MSDFVIEIFKEFSLLVAGPFIKPEMLWIVTPLFVMIFLMTFYFTEHSEDKNGWNDAVTNSASLFFVTLDSLRYIYTQTVPGSIGNFMEHPYLLLLILLIIFESIFLTYSSFKHSLQKFFLRFVTSPLGVYVQMYILIVLVYTQTDPNIYTVFAILLLYLCVAWVLFMFSEFIKKIIMHTEEIES